MCICAPAQKASRARAGPGPDCHGGDRRIEESVVANALAAAELPLAVVSPRQIRDFAPATGKLAKTDRLDAAALADFAEAIRPPARPVLHRQPHKPWAIWRRAVVNSLR